MPQTADQSVSPSVRPSGRGPVFCGLCCLWLRPGHIIRLASERGARLDVNDLPICLSTFMACHLWATSKPRYGGAYEQCQPFGPTLFNFVEQLGGHSANVDAPSPSPSSSARYSACSSISSISLEFLFSPPFLPKLLQLAASRWSVQSSELPASYLIEMLHLFWTTFALT